MCGEKCESGKWGVKCSKSCECFNEGNCHHITGQCQCLPGYYGEKVMCTFIIILCRQLYLK